MSTPTLNFIRVRTADDSADPYDHAISLIDTTLPKDSENDPGQRSPSPGSDGLVKKPTKGSMREQLARRKYAKYQQGRYDFKEGSKEGSIVSNEEQPIQTSADPSPKTDLPIGQTTNGPKKDVADLAQPEEEEEEDSGRGRTGKKKIKHRRRSELPYEIDILYENQRGWFFFGIPLYSHSSLLNFDPSAWVNKDLKDSAVNITNAQVPDPSWMWAWNSWYVDMSDDVDEQGWKYSFSFSKRFTWHGTHPWFHSFVRRRRWLRKRVKRHDLFAHQEKSGTLQAVHQLNSDYFTIHPMRERSPGSFVDNSGKTARPESYISTRINEALEEMPEDIQNIPSLLRALRLANIDREKIDLVHKFVDQGGDELAYLGEKISEILTFMVYQNSRKQILLYLKKAAQEAKRHRDEHDAEQRPEGDAEGRRIDNLLSAVEAADAAIRGLEYSSDRKHVLKTTDEIKKSRCTSKANIDGRQSLDDNPVDTIKGIADKAEVYEDAPKGTSSPPVEDEGTSTNDKGKGKALEQDNGKQEEQNKRTAEDPPRLRFDSVLIPDDDAVNGD